MCGERMGGGGVAAATPGRLPPPEKASANRLGSAHSEQRKTVDKPFTLLAAKGG
jgi:hypothetical protein